MGCLVMVLASSFKEMNGRILVAVDSFRQAAAEWFECNGCGERVRCAFYSATRTKKSLTLRTKNKGRSTPQRSIQTLEKRWSSERFGCSEKQMESVGRLFYQQPLQQLQQRQQQQT